MNRCINFTGLKDINRNNINIGDILSRSEIHKPGSFIFVVENLRDGSFMGFTYPGRHNYLTVHKAMTLEHSPYLYKIGNVHENPELVEEK